MERKKWCYSFFPWPHRKKIQTILIRTILKFDDLPIAHFETDVPLFLKHLWKLGISLKLWVPANSEVRWSRTMTAKMSVFRPLFWRKSLFWPIPTQWTPPSVIHGWKATDLLFLIVKRKKYFLNPISRQNFANAFAETPNLNLEVCLILWGVGVEKNRQDQTALHASTVLVIIVVISDLHPGLNMTIKPDQGMMIEARVVRCFMEEINQVEASYWTLPILKIREAIFWMWTSFIKWWMDKYRPAGPDGREAAWCSPHSRAEWQNAARIGGLLVIR